MDFHDRGILEQHLILMQWAEPRVFPWKVQSSAALVPSHFWSFWSKSGKWR